MTYFNRKYKLTIGAAGQQGIIITDLNIVFNVFKTNSLEPNKMDVSIYNLSPDSRKYCVKDATITLAVGYGDSDFTTLFQGTIVHSATKLSGPDIITEILAGDAYNLMRDSVSAITFPAGTTCEQVIRRLAADMGLAVGSFTNGNLGSTRGLYRKYPKGLSISDPSKTALDNICRSNGLMYHIQEGTLTIVALNTATQESVVLVNAETGMIGTPERVDINLPKPIEPPKEKDTKTKEQREAERLAKQAESQRKKSVQPPKFNGVKFTTLLNPDFRLSRRVKIESSVFPLGMVATIYNVTHKGDYRGSNWHTEVEALV